MPDDTPAPRRPPSSIWAVAALAAGLALGLLGHALGSPGFQVLAGVLKPVGQIWLSALLMTVIPLVIATTLAAVVGLPTSQSAGALGGRALLLFITILAAGGVLAVFLGSALIPQFPVDPVSVATLQAGTPVPEAARQAALAPNSGSFLEWLTGLFPTNLFEAARRGDLLPLLLFALLVGIAVTRLPDEHRDPLTRLFRAAAAAMLTCIRWMLWFLPVGVFIFTYLFVLGAGGVAAGVVGGFVVIVSAAVLVCTGLLYPVTAFFGRTTLREFAHAVAPAQLVAVSTSSSLVSLPALVQGGRERMRLPESATGFVLPFAVSIFKANRTVSSTAKLIFLAHVFGVPLSAGTLVGFLLTVMVLSFSTIGLPGGASAFKTLPAYVAAGIPVEALVIAEAAETIPDIFKTLYNVTANMSAATLLSRSSRAARLGSPVPDTQPATGAT